MAGGLGVDKSKSLPNHLEFAVHLISSLTGEDPSKLAQLTEGDLVTYLSFLLKCEKDKVMKLISHHNQNQDLDFITLSKLWRLVNKNVVKNATKTKKGLPEKVFHEIERQIFTRAELAMINPDLRLAPASTASVNQVRKSQPKIDIAKLRSWMVVNSMSSVSKVQGI